MSFTAQKIRFLVDFSFVSRCLVKATCAGLNSFFSALKTATSKAQAREFFLCFVVKFFNSTVSKDCISQLKEAPQFKYMTWR